MNKKWFSHGIAPWVHENLRKMKLTIFILCISTLTSLASLSYAQSKKLTVIGQNVKVIEILGDIEDQSEFRFFFSNDVDVDRITSIDMKDKIVFEILDELFKGTNIKYEVYERQIALVDKSDSFFNRNYVQQQGDMQQNTVSGRVTDSGGQPLPGVTVVVKGTTQGTVTDANGEYTLSTIPKDATLLFSFVGMRTQELVIGNQTSINVVMEEETVGIEEVVAIGYGTQKKENLTGAVSQVTAEVLESRPIVNIGQGLQGTISNLNITQTTGTTGSGASFNIRGFESINGGEPLILVNGVPMDINLINPNDIESVSVLKDAASAAIYGARAAYGVILITTKTGKKSDKPIISLSVNYGVNEPVLKFKTLDAMQRMEYMNSGSMRQNGTPYPQFNELRASLLIAHYNDPENNPAVSPNPDSPNTFLYHGNTDWPSLLLRDYMPQQQYSATVSGGSDKFDYYASLNYLNQKGIPKQFDETYERYNFMTNLNFEVFKWATIGTKISFNSSEKYFPPNHRANHHDEYTSGFQYHQWANIPPYDTNGNYYSVGSVPNMIQFHKEAGYRSRNIDDLWLTGSAILTPVKNMTFNVDYSTNFKHQNDVSTWRKLEMYFVDGTVSGYFPYTNPSQATKGHYKTRYYTFNVYADYENTFGKHKVLAMVGFNQENQKYEYIEARRDRLMVETMPFMNLAYGEKYTWDGASEFAIRGAFTRVNYNYDNRYLFEFNSRYDGTSKFPQADRFSFFPSASVGWRLDNEPYLGRLKNSFDMLKIRASYGNLGNQSVRENYPYIATYSSGQVSFMMNEELPMTLYAPGLVSPALTWETVEQYDVGVDLAILNNRLNATFDIYQRNTKDMLTKSATLPAVLAVSEPRENAADLKTTGWDLSIEWRQRNEKLKWGIKLLLSDYTSKITKFSNPVGIISDYYVGKNIGEIWGFVTEGIAQTDEEAQALDMTNIVGLQRGAGDLIFKDLDKDGKITYGKSTLDDPGDRKIIGNNTPRYSFGVTSNIEWKGFDLNIFFQGIAKRDYWLNGRYWLNGWNDEWTAHSAVIADWWTPDNTDAFFPRPSITGGRDVQQAQTRYLQNAAYLRLKDLTLGYTIPVNLTQRVKIDKVRVFFSGNNLWETTGIYKYKMLADPEMTNTYQTPINRTYSIGANIYF